MTRYFYRIAAIVTCLAASTLLARPVAAQTQLLQVQNSAATDVMRVADDAGLLVTGAFGAGVIPATGGGVRLMWYPNKAAFRAGRIDAAQWDDGSIGQWSAAFGENTTASGTHSVAMNGGTTASADRSVAMNGGTLASGDLSTAMGQATTASGFAALATGVHTTASGTGALATGDVTTAAGLTSVALGFHVSAGDGSFVFGDRSS